MSVIDPEKAPKRVGSGYPAPFAEVCAARIKRALGDAAGLKNFGVNLTELPPGVWSSQRHWHEKQDEFIFIVEGEVTLVSDTGETVMKAGMCAGFPAGRKDGHQVINKSNRKAVILEVGDRTPSENVDYPDIDMLGRTIDGKYTFVRRDGTRY